MPSWALHFVKALASVFWASCRWVSWKLLRSGVNNLCCNYVRPLWVLTLSRASPSWNERCWALERFRVPSPTERAFTILYTMWCSWEPVLWIYSEVYTWDQVTTQRHADSIGHAHDHVYRVTRSPCARRGYLISNHNVFRELIFMMSLWHSISYSYSTASKCRERFGKQSWFQYLLEPEHNSARAIWSSGCSVECQNCKTSQHKIQLQLD